MNTFTVKKNWEKYLDFSARNKTLWRENSKFSPNNMGLIKLLLNQQNMRQYTNKSNFVIGIFRN